MDFLYAPLNLQLNKRGEMPKGQKIFISYSHVDEHALERFNKHLAMLKRDGLVSEWFDQKILAGGNIDSEISDNLEDCKLFIPLVSPDFLASNYCYEREMTRALERHDAGTMRVAPVIIQACEWKASPLGRLKALPKDGKPVADWTNENNAWLDVVTQLRALVEQMSVPLQDRDRDSDSPKAARASKYRVKRDFDEVDKQEFRERAFNIIREYFEHAVAEVGDIENIKSRFSLIGDDGFTCTVVNRGRERGIAYISVYASGRRPSFGDISYSFAERAERNSANGWFQIETDEYELSLRRGDMLRTHEDTRLSPEQAASELWDEFLEKAGITHA